MNNDIIPNFSKNPDGLIPAVVQNSLSGKVLMLGYMNAEALEKTISTKRVTLYSRTKKRLWVKGETSSNFLNVVHISIDCDRDSILIQATPQGPTCHTGTESCFSKDISPSICILTKLEALLKDNRKNPKDNSYSSKLLSENLARSAQKVGEEGVEVALASVVGSEKELIGEMADLWFHSLVLLAKKDIPLSEILLELKSRNSSE